MSRLSGGDVIKLFSPDRVASTRPSLPPNGLARVISFRKEISKATRIGRFFRGAEFVGSRLYANPDPEVTLRLSPGVIMSKHTVPHVRACRVVWMDAYGRVWIHRVRGVQRSAVDVRDLVLRLEARREEDIGRRDEDQRLGLGGEKIPLPSVNRLFVVSDDGGRVTDPFPITSAKVS